MCERSKDICSSRPPYCRSTATAAPSYSVTPRSLWALDVLIDELPLRRQHLFPFTSRIATASRPRPRHPYLFAAQIFAARITVVDGAMGPRFTCRWRARLFRILPYAWTRWGYRRASTRGARRRRSFICIRGDHPDQPRCPRPGWAASATTSILRRPRRACARC